MQGQSTCFYCKGLHYKMGYCMAELSLEVYRLKKTAIPPLGPNGDGA